MVQAKYANKIRKLFSNDGTFIKYHNEGDFISIHISIAHEGDTLILTIDTKNKKLMKAEIINAPADIVSTLIELVAYSGPTENTPLEELINHLPVETNLYKGIDRTGQQCYYCKCLINSDIYLGKSLANFTKAAADAYYQINR